MVNAPGKDRWFLSYLPMNTSLGISSPLAPLFIIEILKGDVIDYSVFVIVSSLATILGVTLWGNLSDRYGRRKFFVLFGFVSLSISSVLLSVSFSIPYYIGISFISGFLGSAVIPVSSVLIMELTERKHWALKISKFSEFNSVGQIGGVIFAAVFSGFFPHMVALRYLYLFSFGFYLLSAVLGYFLVPESKRSVKRNEIPLGILRAFEKVRYIPSHLIHLNFHFKELERDLKLIIVGFLVMMTGFQLFFVAFPILIKSLDVSSTVFFIIYLGNYFFSAITFGFSGQISLKYGNKKIAMIATIARILIFPMVIAIVGLITYRPMLFIALLLVYSVLGSLWSFISVGTGTLVSNLSKPEERGRVSGTYNAVQSVGAVIGSAITGIVVAGAGYYADILLASVVSAAGLFVLSKATTK